MSRYTAAGEKLEAFARENPLSIEVIDNNGNIELIVNKSKEGDLYNLVVTMVGHLRNETLEQFTEQWNAGVNQSSMSDIAKDLLQCSGIVDYDTYGTQLPSVLMLTSPADFEQDDSCEMERKRLGNERLANEHLEKLPMIFNLTARTPCNKIQAYKLLETFDWDFVKVYALLRSYPNMQQTRKDVVCYSKNMDNTYDMTLVNVPVLTKVRKASSAMNSNERKQLLDEVSKLKKHPLVKSWKKGIKRKRP